MKALKKAFLWTVVKGGDGGVVVKGGLMFLNAKNIHINNF